MGAIYGIVGEIQKERVNPAIEKIALSLEFRGREKMYDRVAPTAVFGVRSHGKALNDAALSMQDQPATVCAVEGEIYNQPGLIRGMGRKDGYRNAAELLARLYESHGADFCRGCNGVFYCGTL